MEATMPARTIDSRFQSHFRRRDPRLYAAIKQIGPYKLRPSRDRFGMLVRSIISQQISVGAARSIRQKLELLIGDAGLTPAAIVAQPPDKLRAAGLSQQKASYLVDLAGKANAGEVRLSRIGRLSDEEVIAELTQIKGIGRWTAQMFLIFALGRPDVFPIDDFGVRAALAKLYGYDEHPPKAKLLEIGQSWSPYASIGSWYCWRYLELLKQQKLDGQQYPV
jgi:DNA-3-methyladenine glycosylase II